MFASDIECTSIGGTLFIYDSPSPHYEWAEGKKKTIITFNIIIESRNHHTYDMRHRYFSLYASQWHLLVCSCWIRCERAFFLCILPIESIRRCNFNRFQCAAGWQQEIGFSVCSMHFCSFSMSMVYGCV